MELEIGILRVEQRDPAQGNLLRRWMESRVMPEFAERTLPVDTIVALRCAVPASTCRIHGPNGMR